MTIAEHSTEPYVAASGRYDELPYVRCGKSGLMLPRISLGLWQNFGVTRPLENSRVLLRRAFDLGITHFDLANNYGPPPGAAEVTFGQVLRDDFLAYRDEMIISSKAGYYMGPGPYGDWGSRKYMLASLDQSLKRTGLDYFDIFYSHRPDPDTPIEETMGALDHAVRSGKALYAGISNYSGEQTRAAAAVLRALGTPCIIHQAKYSMFERRVETGLLDAIDETGLGLIVFSPLAQGLLTNRYLDGMPEDSRVAQGGPFLKSEHLTPEKIGMARQLNALAQARGQSLAQFAITWIFRQKQVTSALIGASKTSQIEELCKCVSAPALTSEEAERVEAILQNKP
jgi:L-glyceraldehyde 3-phosphate reductase